MAYTRDQDVALDFPTLALALERVARGEVGAGRGAAHPTAHMCWWRGAGERPWRGRNACGGLRRVAACIGGSLPCLLGCWLGTGARLGS